MATRRRTLLTGLVCSAAIGRSAGAQVRETPIVQPAAATPAGFLRRAFEMRDLALKAGDQGFGAVVVRESVIVGEAPSRVVANTDPTAHAEMEAIRDAARRLHARSLTGAVLYSSFRPCPMCEAAAYWAGISRMVYGEAATDGGAPRLNRG
ncbi:MAG: nucleoside deaminase [Alphaproteobacteria bacterium]|nr:nucleoside deaminase [Alphaproteobacteria bacterium]